MPLVVIEGGEISFGIIFGITCVEDTSVLLANNGGGSFFATLSQNDLASNRTRVQLIALKRT